MRDFYVFFLYNETKSEVILNKTVEKIVSEEFDGYSFKFLKEKQIPVLDASIKQEYIAVLPLDMPLLRPEDLTKLIETMWRKNISQVEAGSGQVFKRICKENKGHYRVNDEAFTEYSDSKNKVLIYNKLRLRKIENLLESGAMIFDPQSTTIDLTVNVQKNAKIFAGTSLYGSTVVKSGAEISESFIKNSVISQNSIIEKSYIKNAVVGKNTKIEPFTKIVDSKIGANSQIESLQIVKSTMVGKDCVVGSMSYLENGDIGDGNVFGCQTYFDIKNKKEKVHILSDNNFPSKMSFVSNAQIFAKEKTKCDCGGSCDKCENKYCETKCKCCGDCANCKNFNCCVSQNESKCDVDCCGDCSDCSLCSKCNGDCKNCKNFEKCKKAIKKDCCGGKDNCSCDDNIENCKNSCCADCEKCGKIDCDKSKCECCGDCSKCQDNKN